MTFMRQTGLGLLAIFLAFSLSTTHAQDCKPNAEWTEWNNFRNQFIDEGGRVIDRGSERLQSTSEGQSYALFFALVANDRAAFERILNWTEKNLAGGDMTGRLPAWLWGKRDDASWGIIDTNPASDSDVWIAYSLLEAGRLWKMPKYSALGELIAERILREETDELPGLGRTLLPAPTGFHPDKLNWRLNPSYVPLQLVQRLATLLPKSAWRSLVSSSVDLTVRSAPRGFAPEWVLYHAEDGFKPDAETRAEGSFNAIRVYLWAGMLPGDEPLRPVLLKRFAPMAQYVIDKGAPPLKVDTRQGTAEGVGPGGFSAALLPFLASSGHSEAMNQQRLRLIAAGTLERQDNYYDQVLGLFGLGWADGLYKFGRNGVLMPRWACAKG